MRLLLLALLVCAAAARVITLIGDAPTDGAVFDSLIARLQGAVQDGGTGLKAARPGADWMILHYGWRGVAVSRALSKAVFHGRGSRLVLRFYAHSDFSCGVSVDADPMYTASINRSGGAVEITVPLSFGKHYAEVWPTDGDMWLVAGGFVGDGVTVHDWTGPDIGLPGEDLEGDLVLLVVAEDSVPEGYVESVARLTERPLIVVILRDGRKAETAAAVCRLAERCALADFRNGEVDMFEAAVKWLV